MRDARKRSGLAALLTICFLAGCGWTLAGCGKDPEDLDNAWKEAEYFQGEPIQSEGDFQEFAQSQPMQGTSADQSLPDTSADQSLPNASADQSVQDASADRSMPEEPPSLSLVMVGDILLHTPVAESGLMEDGSYDFDPLFAQMKSQISEADLALVNQEVILGGTELGISGYPSFNAPYELGDALVNAGFDVVLHATNHALDKRKKGLLNCLEYWQTSHPEIAVLGIHDSAQDQEEIYLYEQDGMTLAILNYTYSTNGVAMPEDMPFAVDMLDQDKMEKDLAKARELADFIIVCPHWGTEYQLEPSSAQEKWARFFLENGVDLVLGTHPHVIEPVEWLEDEEGRRMLVYYSLGNFLNWTSGTGDGVANRMVGGMAKVSLTRASDGTVEIADYGIVPVVCHLEEGFGGVTVYPLSDYTEELADANEICDQDGIFLWNIAGICANRCGEVPFGFPQTSTYRNSIRASADVNPSEWHLKSSCRPQEQAQDVFL